MERLDPRTTVILVIDVQEKLARAMPAETLSTLERNLGILLDAAAILEVPVLASEQYPQGLGATLPSVARRLEARSVVALPKLTFDACADLAIARALSALDPRAVVVAGMETHVCVFQTARELVRRGPRVHIVADAVSSRRDENRTIGLSLCERAGAVIDGTESVVFDLLERAGTDAFRAVSRLVR